MHAERIPQEPENALVGHVEDAPPTAKAIATSEAGALMQMITRAASDPSVDMDKLERLMTMHKEIVAGQREVEFNQALARAQSSMGRVVANKRNSQTSSDYADYAAIDRMARPLYSAEGLSLSFDTGTADKEGEIRIICLASHSSGHTRQYHVDMPADGKGAKGGDVMTKTHATGSAMSYGKRYLVQGIFNIAIGKDDDGNGASGKRVSEQQEVQLKEFAAEVSADVPGFLSYMKADAFSDILAKDFPKAMNALKAKERANRKGAEA